VTSLFEAAKAGDAEGVRGLLARGVAVDARGCPDLPWD
jgi:hypothetical protein